MAKPLKEQNTLRLLAVVFANLAIFFMMLNAEDVSVAAFQRLAGDLRAAIPATLAIGLLAVLNGYIDAKTKARLVFWRWANPLPGCRAFSEHGPRDPRVDLGALERILGKLPVEPRDQNTAWYRIYKSVESDPGVSHNHRDFLFARDYASLSALFIVVLGGFAVYQFDSWRRVFAYVGFLAAQYLVARHVATRYGHRFVTTVMAVKAAAG